MRAPSSNWGVVCFYNRCCAIVYVSVYVVMLELPAVNGTFFFIFISDWNHDYFPKDVCMDVFAQSQTAESTALCIHEDYLLIGLKRWHISKNIKQEIQTINSLENRVSKCLYKIWLSFFQNSAEIDFTWLEIFKVLWNYTFAVTPFQ